MWRRFSRVVSVLAAPCWYFCPGTREGLEKCGDCKGGSWAARARWWGSNWGFASLTKTASQNEWNQVASSFHAFWAPWAVTSSRATSMEHNSKEQAVELLPYSLWRLDFKCKHRSRIKIQMLAFTSSLRLIFTAQLTLIFSFFFFVW